MNDQGVRQFMDERAIIHVIQRYCRGIDRCDRSLLESCYWDDARDNHGTYDGSAKGFIDFVLPLVTGAYSATTHMLGQSSIVLRGEVAAVETYVLAFHRLGTPSAGALNLIAGRYVDRFERRGGEWRIADRTLVVDWVQNQPDGALPKGARAITPDLFTGGRRDPTDVGSQLLNDSEV
ncbi:MULTISPECIES: nuclear transport factor 2 family protein [unclassified Sphingobium]|uniref:nuclear transport factor 2 family protein n=1 Tax=unclassified Sphingobium TaxID=2611147 RepID=UPI00119AA8A0|nr:MULTISPECIES: nuclear transport factor 2 family protein [unclassified Sphingobium]MBG6119956.1 hypothetical protein [Sphingobium sp. JAI105]TWC99605.1 SnoaL-like protein [Sphingobium sp. AEW010]TWD18958.1 SnoaL-like protein [Sphingobium sp. AEW013]TWD21829.1 SnoaL-like protein [Sphingobium sp. AEW001]